MQRYAAQQVEDIMLRAEALGLDPDRVARALEHEPQRTQPAAGDAPEATGDSGAPVTPVP